MFQPTIGVVIPAYNRRDNLYRCLGVLSWQTWQDFVVVIADDGSTDDTAKLMRELQQTPFWQERLIYVSGGPRRGMRTGRVRNLGAANLPPTVRVMVKLDTDMLLSENALADFMACHAKFPRAVLMGQIDWLPPLKFAEIDTILATTGLSGLRTRVPDSPAERVEGVNVGRDLRRAGIFEYSGTPLPMQTTWGLPGNAAYPLDVFWEIGGYDETMRGYGFQDLEFAERAARTGLDVVPLEAVYCLHIWHSKTAEVHMFENQRNLDYVIRKYQAENLDPTRLQWFENNVDWSTFWHYNRERGGQPVRVDDELWVLNPLHTHRIKLPDARWLAALQFSEEQVREITAGNLANIRDEGVAFDPIGDGLDYLPPPPHNG